MLFKEEFKKLAEEKGMTCPELAKKIIDMFTDEEGCMSFGGYVVDKCTLKETLPVTDPETSDQRRVLGYDLSKGDDMTLKRRANAFYGKGGEYMRKNKNILVVVPRERIKNYVSTVIKAELRDLKPVIFYTKKADGSRIDFVCCCGWRIRIATEDEMRNLTHTYAYSWNWVPLSSEHQRPRIIHRLDKLEQLRAVVEGRIV